MKAHFLAQGILAAVVGFASFATFANDYQAGQVWKYKTRINEEDSRVYIVKVDQWANGDKVYHVSVDGLKMKSPILASGFQRELIHAPVTAASLDSSVTDMQGTTEKLPDISEGYNTWKKHFDDGQAGAYSLPLKDIIDNNEKALNAFKH